MRESTIKDRRPGYGANSSRLRILATVVTENERLCELSPALTPGIADQFGVRFDCSQPLLHLAAQALAPNGRLGRCWAAGQKAGQRALRASLFRVRIGFDSRLGLGLAAARFAPRPRRS